MSNATKKFVTSSDDVKSFVVQCTSIDDAHDIMDYAHAHNARCVVYRSDANAERATLRRERDKMLRQLGIAQLRGASNINELKASYVAFCRAHDFDE